MMGGCISRKFSYLHPNKNLVLEVSHHWHLSTVASRCGPWNTQENHTSFSVKLSHSQMLNDPVTQFHHIHKTARYLCCYDCVTVYTCINSHKSCSVQWQCVIEYFYSYKFLCVFLTKRFTWVYSPTKERPLLKERLPPHSFRPNFLYRVKLYLPTLQVHSWSLGRIASNTIHMLGKKLCVILHQRLLKGSIV